MVSIIIAGVVAGCLVTIDESLLYVDAGGVRLPDGALVDPETGAILLPDGGRVDPPRDGGDADAPPSTRRCPQMAGTGPMVLIDDFCIDERETTVAEYRTFLLGAVPSVPSECGWKTRYEPPYWPFAAAEDGLPVYYVDWCAAWAYCAWAGKRLCGGPGGAKLDVTKVNAANDEWYRACSNGGATQWSYGASYLSLIHI